MRSTRSHRLAVLLLAGLALGGVAAAQQARLWLGLPPAEVQTLGFSVNAGDPLTATGISPGDILGLGGGALVACSSLGLLCQGEAEGVDDVQGLSSGWDFAGSGAAQVAFSVAAGSSGKAGSAVRGEAGCTPAEAASDVFLSGLDGKNTQALDGNGKACGSRSGYGLGLSEGAAADHVDALVEDPCQYLDPGCSGAGAGMAFFTLADGSPSLLALGLKETEILVSGVDTAPLRWAEAAAFGLQSGDVIDALCVGENGNGVYDGGDLVLFSLAAGSPTLAVFGGSGADLLRPGPLRLAYPASALGLLAGDDLNGLSCPVELSERLLFVPFIRRR